MSLTINDAQDSAHSAAMDVRAWAQEWAAEWMRPQMEMQQAQGVEQVLMLWDRLPPEAHETMMKSNPEQYAQVEAKIKALKKRKAG
jgi:hypothetical protein